MLRSLCFAAILSGWWGGAVALDPALDVAQYAHTAWRIREGFAAGHQFTAIAQTTDGYLWLGGQSGLIRFDGVSALLWKPPGGQVLPDQHIVTLLGARDGTLWIGTWKGLASWKAGRFTSYPQLPAQFVLALVEDHDGTLWISTASADPAAPRMLCTIRNGEGSCERLNASIGQITSMCEDGKQQLWAATTTGLWRLQPRAAAAQTLNAPVTSTYDGLVEDSEGALLIATRRGISRFDDATGESTFAVLPGTAGLLRDRDGSVWIRTSFGGLFHMHEGRMDTFGNADGLSGEPPASLIEDREGSIWVATEEGLDRFRNLAVPTISMRQGLSSPISTSVSASRDGSVWITTPQGLGRWRNEEITVYLGEGKAEQKPTLPRVTGRSPVRQLHVPGFPTTEGSLFEDPTGRLWIATHESTGFLKDGRYTRIEGISGGFVDAIAGDAAGNLWFAHRSQGLLRVSRDLNLEQIPWERLGKYGTACCLAADPKDGSLWLGFLLGGIVHFVDGQVREAYSSADGLAAGRVRYLRAEPDGILWIGAENGLSRLKQGRLVTLNRSRGLPCDSVDWMEPDDLGAVWVYTACGIARIDRSELDSWTSEADRGAGANQRVRATVFDSADGVLSVDFLSSYSPHVAKARDGKLWFVTRGGVGVLDPRHLPKNALPPPVHVERIVADREVYEADRPQLPPLVRDLEIDYTALSLAVPEKVLFRYQLEGHDRSWRDAGNRRQVLYSGLAPGNYLFRVIASNESGVWNERGATLGFTIAPAYWQTSWFRALCVLVFVALLWLAYQLRLRQLTSAFQMTLEARVSERTRIARELHDTLLQSFQGLLLRFQTVAELLPDRPADAKRAMLSTVDQAAQAIRDGRDAVQGLRASVVESADLAGELRAVGELAASESGNEAIGFRVEVEGAPCALKPIVRDEIYRIAGEALRNAFRHAQARQIEVELRYDPRQLRLRVRDDGKGVDLEIVQEGGKGAIAHHHGLRGMRERAGLIGGKLTVWSAPKSGTEVELVVPASRAYARSRPRRGSWIFDRIARKKARVVS